MKDKTTKQLLLLATPRPWIVPEKDYLEPGRYLTTEGQMLIADFYSDSPYSFDLPDKKEYQANAELLYRAMNSFEALLRVSRLLNEAMTKWSADDSDMNTLGEWIERVGLDDMDVKAALKLAEKKGN